jgi:CRP-like cAMP-binding protein
MTTRPSARETVTSAISRLDADHRAWVRACAHEVTFAAGDYLLREGEPADTLYLLRAGTVAIELFAPARGPLTIETVGAGDIVGWSWMFPPYRLQFDARALSAVTADAVDAACLRGQCAADSAFGYDLLSQLARVLAERLQATRFRLLDVYRNPARG